MAAELKKNLGIESTLTPGHGGIFEVIADGKVVFSKKSVGRFPEPGEVLGLLSSA